MQLFQNGVPVQSTVALTQDLFKYAGELMAMSTLQGGPAPNYFSPAIYEVIANGLWGANLCVDMIEKSPLKETANRVIYSISYLDDFLLLTLVIIDLGPCPYLVTLILYGQGVMATYTTLNINIGGGGCFSRFFRLHCFTLVHRLFFLH